MWLPAVANKHPVPSSLLCRWPHPARGICSACAALGGGGRQHCGRLLRGGAPAHGCSEEPSRGGSAWPRLKGETVALAGHVAKAASALQSVPHFVRCSGKDLYDAHFPRCITKHTALVGRAAQQAGQRGRQAGVTQPPAGQLVMAAMAGPWDRMLLHADCRSTSLLLGREAARACSTMH